MSEQNQNQTNQESGDKTEKRYQSVMNKLTAIVGGKENIYPEKKIAGDALTEVVDGLLKERKEEVAKEVKTGLKELLSKKIELDRVIKEEEEKLAKLKIQKKKEFVEAADKIFKKVENIEQLEKDYFSSLTEATGAIIPSNNTGVEDNTERSS